MLISLEVETQFASHSVQYSRHLSELLTSATSHAVGIGKNTKKNEIGFCQNLDYAAIDHKVLANK